MIQTRRHQARRSGHSTFGLLSVLALLALACFVPVAQASEATGIEYNDAPPTATGIPQTHNTHPSEPPAKSSNAETGGATAGGAGGGNGSNGSGSGGAGSGGGSASGLNPSTAGEGGTSQANPGKGSTVSPQTGSAAKSKPQSTAPASSSDGGSSPLVPILILLAVLAAISIGALVIRQRRQNSDGPGAAVSPKAS